MFRIYNPANLPPVTKNLLIINFLMVLATHSMTYLGYDLTQWLALYYPGSGEFRPYQLITYMFMHADYGHMLSNMIGLFLFGAMVENTWGSARFFAYWILTGLGAAALHYGSYMTEVHYYELGIDERTLQMVKDNGMDIFIQGKEYVDDRLNKLAFLYREQRLVGASGSLFGLLLAFAMLFPNMMLIFPFPMKVRYLIIFYGVMEVVNIFKNNPYDNVAHYAHLGGMLFGYLIIRFWRSRGTIR